MYSWFYGMIMVFTVDSVNGVIKSNKENLYPVNQIISINNPSNSRESRVLNYSTIELAKDIYLEGIPIYAVTQQRDQIYIRGEYDSKITVIKIGNNANMSESDVQDFHIGISPGLSQIAIDSISGNVYWADILFRWIALKPRVKESNPVLIDNIQIVVDNLSRPEGLAVDDSNKLMFWASNGNNPNIEMASLLGTNRQLVVSEGIMRAISLTVDQKGKRIFWLNAHPQRGQIESSKYDGSDRRFIISQLEFRTLSFQSPNVLISTGFKDNKLEALILQEEKIPVVVEGTPPNQSIAISTSDLNAEYENNECSKKKCHHYCVYTNGDALCRCYSGFLLYQDGVSCLGPSGYRQRGFVYAIEDAFCILDIASIFGYNLSRQCIALGNKRVTHITADTDTYTVYLSTTENGGSLYTYSWTTKHIKHFTNNTGTIGDLKYAHKDRFLIWTNIAIGSIIQMSVDSKIKRTLYSGLNTPRSLVLDERGRRMFLILSGTNQIISLNIDGTNRRQLVVSENPRILTFDWRSNTLFWATNNAVFNMDVEKGGGSKIYSDGDWKYLKSILFYRGYMMFVGQFQNHSAYIKSTSMETKEEVANIGFETTATISDVLLMDDLITKHTKDACDVGNGGCSQICYSNSRSDTCSCYIGFHMTDTAKCEIGNSSSDYILFQGRPNQLYGYDLNEGNLNARPTYPNTGTIKDFVALTENRIYYITDLSNARQVFSNIGQSYTVVPENYTAERLATVPYSDDIYILGRHSKNESGLVARFNLGSKTVSSIYLNGNLVDLTFNPLSRNIFVLKCNNQGTSFVEIENDMKKTRDIVPGINNKTRYCASLAFDITRNSLFFSTKNGYIFSVQLDKLVMEQFILDIDAKITDIDFYGEDLYYLIRNKRSIVRINKIDRTSRKTVLYSPVFLDMNNIFIFQEVKCPLTIPNGELEDDCHRQPGKECRVICSKGFKSLSSNKITCNILGIWENDTSSVCLPVIVVRGTTDTDTSGQTVSVVFNVILAIIVTGFLLLSFRRWLHSKGRAVPCFGRADLYRPKNEQIQLQGQLEATNRELEEKVRKLEADVSYYEVKYKEKCETERYIQDEPAIEYKPEGDNYDEPSDDDICYPDVERIRR